VAIAYLLVVVVPVTLIASLMILIVVKPYEYVFQRNRGPRMTPWQVANVIERAASDRVDNDEWDDFSCVPMRDSRLDAAVKRAVEIVEVERPAGRLSADQASQELRQLANQLRGWNV
jgi:hypothetical protein